MPEVLLVKLGGSLITDKRRPESVRRRTLRRLADELAAGSGRTRARLLLGHGSGSFGHAAAARYGLNPGKCRAEQLPGVSITQDRAASLHRVVIQTLQRAGALPFSLAPSSFLTTLEGRPVGLGLEPLLLSLKQRMLPVVFGDVVLDRRWGASICSTESVFLALARGLRRRGYIIRRALWLGETEGIYDHRGATIRRVDSARGLKRALDHAGGAKGTDVTGGMVHRLETAGALARIGIASWIGDGRVPGRLQRLLAGESVPGTRIDPM